MRQFLSTIGFGFLLSLSLAGCQWSFSTTTGGGVSPEVMAYENLVPKTLTQGETLRIELPQRAESERAATKLLSLNPEIKGRWELEEDFKTVFFTPKEELESGRFYSLVYGTAEDPIIKGQFEIVSAPKVVNIFPAEGTEVSERSEITIIFNRPMVPLTSLDQLEAQDVPVQLTPETAGKWKWIGTRTLQFTPTERLQRSTKYTVELMAGWSSVEGAKTEAVTSKFNTRPLRNLSVSARAHTYNQPLQVVFNQPVNLEATKPNIILERFTNDENFTEVIGFVAKYQKNKKEENKSVIEIYPTTDSFGRLEKWDLETRYRIKVNQVIPAEGDIVLNESINSTIEVTNIVKNSFTSSERYAQTDASFFDFTGHFHLEFYEAVNLEKTLLEGDKIKSVNYGKKCVELPEGAIKPKPGACEKEEDLTRLVIDFLDNSIEKGEVLNLSLSKIFNESGDSLLERPINYRLQTIKPLEVLKTHMGDTTSMTLCTTTPLLVPAKEEISEAITANKAAKNLWQHRSYQASKQHNTCGAGSFVTRITYGLIPEQDYEFLLKLSDFFEDNIEHKVLFKTEALPKTVRNFKQYQSAYSVTPPTRTTLTYSGFNVDYFEVHLCQLSPEKMLKTLLQKPQHSEAPSDENCSEVQEFTIDLDHKFWEDSFFQLDLKDYMKTPYGHYMLTFSHPEYTNRFGQEINQRTYVTVTDLAVVEKNVEFSDRRMEAFEKDKLTNVYWVSNLNTLEAIPEASVALYTRKDYKDEAVFMTSGATDEAGLIKLKNHHDHIGAIIKKNEDSAVVLKNNSGLNYAYDSYVYDQWYSYTDRPIYRPGHKVEGKVIHREVFNGEFHLVDPATEFVFTITDSQGNKIQTETKKLTDYGTFTFDMRLDASAPLGRYSLNVRSPNYEHESYVGEFEVEEYVPAAFKVETTLDQAEYVSGETLNLDIAADYYFGVPVEGGTVEYSLVAQDFNFDRSDSPEFRFGQAWYRCWYDCYYGDEFLARGQTSLDDQGKAKIKQVLDFKSLLDEGERPKSKIITVRMQVKNTNGQSIAVQKSFILHAGEYYIGLGLDHHYGATDETRNLRLKTLDGNGEIAAKKDLEISIGKIEWNQVRRQEVDGGWYYNSEKTVTPVIEKKLTTDSEGAVSLDFVLKEEGSYEVLVTGKDSRGNLISSQQTLYIYGTSTQDYTPRVVQKRNDASLDITVAQKSVNAGDKASFIIHNPYPKSKALISIERGGIWETKIVNINQNLYQYEFDVLEDYLPNIYVSVTLLHGGNEPGVKHATVEYQINTEVKNLAVTIKSDKESYLPGEKVTLDLQVSDKTGAGAKAEISVGVVDKSVLALKGNPTKNPVPVFYPSFSHSVSTSSNIKNILYEVEVSAGKGGDGGENDGLATRKRGEFKDTALWKGIVETDDEGKATINFELPDNLTTWQTEVVALTKDTQLGVGYEEFTSQKELMLVPVKPRFVVPGDVFELGAKVFNQTDKPQTLEVFASSPTLILQTGKPRKIKLNAGETKVVWFETKAPVTVEEGVHIFTLGVEGEALSDVVKTQINLTPNETYEATATAGMTTQESTKEYLFLPSEVLAGRSEVNVNVAATLAVFLEDGLLSLLKFPHGCAEQIASKLEALAILSETEKLGALSLDLPEKPVRVEDNYYTIEAATEIGLSRLYANQKSGGGFAYYPSLESDFYLSLRVLNSLRMLSDSGFKVDENRMKKAANFVFSQLQKSSNQFSSDRNSQFQNNRQAFDRGILIFATEVLLGLPESSRVNEERLAVLVKEKVLDLNNENILWLNEKSTNLMLTKLGVLLASNPDYFDATSLDLVLDTLESRLSIDARGAQLPIQNSRSWNYYETPVGNTAAYLEVLTAAESDNPVTGSLINWLIQSRSKDGAWGSTANTLSVLKSLTAYVLWKEEHESSFELRITLDDEALLDHTWKPENVGEPQNLKLENVDALSGKLTTVKLQKNNLNQKPNTLYYNLDLRYALPMKQVLPRDEGFLLSNDLYKLEDTDLKLPQNSAYTGEVLRGKIKLVVPERRNLVAIEVFIPAGLELINDRLSTESTDEFEIEQTAEESELYKQEIPASYTELRDDRLYMFVENLSPGNYEYDYYVRALVPGTYQHLPATVQEFYTPEVFGRARGQLFRVKKP